MSNIRDRILAKQNIAGKVGKAKPLPEPAPMPVPDVIVEAKEPPAQKTKKGSQMNWKDRKFKKIKDRLPHGSEFHTRYDAEKVLWTCTLSIPGFAVMERVGSGLWWCMEKLDDDYREMVMDVERQSSQPHPAPAEQPATESP